MKPKNYELIYDQHGENPVVADMEMYRAMFLLSGWTWTSEHELQNGYFPQHIRFENPQTVQPWLMVMTEWGPVQLGWRKRVISIEWSASKYPQLQIMEDENVTNKPGLIHAWSHEKAITYLKELKLQFERQDYIEGLDEPKKSEEIARFATSRINHKKWCAEHELEEARRLVAANSAQPIADVSTREA